MTAAAVDRLRHARNLLAANPRTAWIADAIAEYLANARTGATLDSAFGVAPLPYSAPWWEAESLRRRDELVMSAAVFFSPPNVPRKIEVAARRYAASRWKAIDRTRTEMPAEYVGRLDGVLFELQKIEPRWPFSSKTIGKIIKDQRLVMEGNGHNNFHGARD